MRRWPGSKIGAITLLVVASIWILGTGAAWAAESTTTVNLSDSTIAALAAAVASEVASVPVPVEVVSAPPVSVDSSSSGALSVAVAAVGGLDAYALTFIGAIGVLCLGAAAGHWARGRTW